MLTKLWEYFTEIWFAFRVSRTWRGFALLGVETLLFHFRNYLQRPQVSSSPFLVPIKLSMIRASWRCAVVFPIRVETGSSLPTSLHGETTCPRRRPPVSYRHLPSPIWRTGTA